MIVFQVSLKFWSSERNTENTISDLYFNEKVIILRKIYLTIKPFALPIKSFFLSCFRMSLNREKRVVMRAMRKKQKKLNIFTLQLLIYYILEQEISIGARGKHLVIQLLWASPRLSVTRVSLIYLVDEFLSSFLV